MKPTTTVCGVRSSTRQRTTDASAGERFVRKTFDHAGRETFSRLPGPMRYKQYYTMLNTGIDTAYDALRSRYGHLRPTLNWAC
jgi:hypothetical protein